MKPPPTPKQIGRSLSRLIATMRRIKPRQRSTRQPQFSNSMAAFATWEDAQGATIRIADQ